MLVIRFFRTGKKNQPSFKIVVTDKRRATRGGRFIEEVGFFNPLTKEKVMRAERIKYWISVGAEPSDRVYNLLIKEKIIEGKKIPLHKTKKETSAKILPAQATSEKPVAEKKEAAKETKAEIQEPKKEETKAGETAK